MNGPTDQNSCISLDKYNNKFGTQLTPRQLVSGCVSMIVFFKNFQEKLPTLSIISSQLPTEPQLPEKKTCPVKTTFFSVCSCKGLYFPLRLLVKSIPSLPRANQKAPFSLQVKWSRYPAPPLTCKCYECMILLRYTSLNKEAASKPCSHI